MTKQPIVSVIIPTHNRAGMLKRAIDSVLSQTYKDFELIIVDDGSKDNTRQVAESYKDKRIRFFQHKTTKGASAARNTGIKKVRGKYLAFLDDDDEWIPKKLEKQMPIIINSSKKVGLVYGWMEYFQDGKSIKVYNPKLKGNVFKSMLSTQAIGGCPTLVIKKEVIQKVGLFDENLPRGNDGDFIRRISKYYLVDFIPEIVANVYVGHKDRISVNTKKSINNVIHALKYRLVQFKSDFQAYPDEHAKVLFKIAEHYLMLNKFTSWYKFARKASKISKNYHIIKKMPYWVKFYITK